MKEQILDDLELDLDDIKSILRKQGKKIGIQKLIAKNNSITAIKSDTIKVQILVIEGKIKLNNGFPTLGNPVQMVSSSLFLVVFFLLSIPFFLIFAFIFGQVFSLLYHSPKTNKFKKEIRKVIINSKLK